MRTRYLKLNRQGPLDAFLAILSTNYYYWSTNSVYFSAIRTKLKSIPLMDFSLLLIIIVIIIELLLLDASLHISWCICIGKKERSRNSESQSYHRQLLNKNVFGLQDCHSYVLSIIFFCWDDRPWDCCNWARTGPRTIQKFDLNKNMFDLHDCCSYVLSIIFFCLQFMLEPMRMLNHIVFNEIVGWFGQRWPSPWKNDCEWQYKWRLMKATWWTQQ